jgi:hypothetical protein
MVNRIAALALALALPVAARSAPVLVYSTPTPDGWNGWHEDVATDAAGNVYRAATPYVDGRVWVEVQKLDPAGRLVASWPLDPAVYRVTAIAVDALGRIHLGGWVYPGFVTTPDAPATGTQGGFYARLSAAGAVEFATLVPLEPNDIATDAAGRAYLAGGAQYDAVTLPLATTPDALRATPAGGVFMRLDPAGRIEYATFLGGSVADHPYSVAVDPAGNVFVAGVTQSPDFPVKDALEPALPAPTATFLVKFGPANDLQWGTYLGGTTGGPYGPVTVGSAVSVGPDGGPVVAGVTSTTDFPLVNAIQSSASPYPGYVTKFSADGRRLVYSTLFAEGGAEGVAVDRHGVAHVTGRARGWVPRIDPIGFTLTGWGSQGHQFLARVDPAGGLVFATLVSGNRDEIPYSIAVDGIGSTVLLGRSRSSDFPWVRAPQGAFAYIVKIGVGLPGEAQAQGWFAAAPGTYGADPALAPKVDLLVRASLAVGAEAPAGEVRVSVRGTPVAFAGGVPDALVAYGKTVEIHGGATDAAGQPLRFVVSLVDGAARADLARVKVWSASTGAVLFDSQPGEAPWAAPTRTVFGAVSVSGS